MHEIMTVLWLGIATGAISLVISKSALLNGFHDWLEPRAPFLEEMLSCPWCTSHWVGLFFTLVYRPLLVDLWRPIDYIVTLMVIVTIASVTARIIYSAYKPIMG